MRCLMRRSGSTLLDTFSMAMTKKSFLSNRSSFGGHFQSYRLYRPSFYSFCNSLKKFEIDLLLQNRGEKSSLNNPEDVLIQSHGKAENFVKENHILEFKPELSWEDVVVKSEIPIVVDCFANWCNPCKKLYPKLIEKLEEMKNFRLVKVNIDENPDLTESLNVHNVPTCFLVYKQNIVDHFVGIPDDKRLKEFFDTINILVGISQNDQVIRSLLKGADEWMNKEQWDNAENMFIEANSYEKWKEAYGSIIKLGLALCCFHKGQFDKSEGFVTEIKQFYKKDLESDEILRKKIALLEIKLNLAKNPSLSEEKIEDFRSKIRDNPKDLELRYKFALHEFENNSFESAVDILLDIIKIDRNWNDKAANNLLLKIFGYLGSSHELTVRGRKNLTKILY